MKQSHKYARLMRSRLAFVLALVGAVSTAHAHTSLPAYLELKEATPGSFEMLWRVPAAEGPPPAIYPVFPSHCVVPKHLAAEDAPGSVVERGVIECGSKWLAGDTIEIDNLKVTIVDVLVRITFADGISVTQILRPLAPSSLCTRTDAAASIGWAMCGSESATFCTASITFSSS